MNDPLLMNASQSNTMLHKHFTQSLNDFKWIASDFNVSQNFWLSNPILKSSTLTPPVGVGTQLDSFQILHAGIWKLIDYDRCRLPESIAQSYRSVESIYVTLWSNKRLLLNTKYSRAIISARLWNFQPRPLLLQVSLHQLAILDQYNDTTEQMISYDTLINNGGFIRESNAKLALLSLVYAGLLKSRDQQEGMLQFELNKAFYKAHQGTKVKDLSALEQVNFWSEDLSTVASHTANLAKTLAEEDIYLATTASSVEDVGQNCAMILRSEIAQASSVAGEPSGPGPSTSTSTNRDIGQHLLESQVEQNSNQVSLYLYKF